jgi:hypothetical protein
MLACPAGRSNPFQEATMLIAAALLACAPLQDPNVSVVAPHERQVFQRDQRDGADVALIVRAPKSVGRLTASVMPAAGGDTVVGATLAMAAGDQPAFLATLRVPKGGWYRLSVLVDGIAGPVEVAHVERFGVGEVFVVAGQSNSTNYGEERTPALDDRVSAFDGQRWTLAQDPMPGVQDGSTGGSPWPACGRDLVAALGVPVAFASCGYGGTNLAQWQKGAKLDEKSALSLYEGLRRRVLQLGGDVRAILWHQGEADAHGGTSTEDYVKRFRALADALKADTQCAAPWIVANVSFVPGETKEKMDAIRAAQQQLWKDKLALQGPDTDDLLGEMRHSKDHIHFSKAGLEAHGKRWAQRIQALLFAKK